MSSTRLARCAMILVAALGLASIAFVSSSSHEEQDASPTQGRDGGPGPRRDAAVDMPRNLVGLGIDLGLRDTVRTEHQGEISVSEGRVVSLQVVRSAPSARVDGNRFEVTSKAVAKKKKKQAGVRGPALLATIDAPESATVTVSTGPTRSTFKLADLRLGKAVSFLDGEASITRQPSSARLTGRGTEDDFPAAAAARDETSAWLAYVEYHPDTARLTDPPKPAEFDRLVPKNHGDVIRLRKFDGKTWHPALDVTEGKRDVWRPSVAISPSGVVWVAWAEQIDGDWEILCRGHTPGEAGAAGTWTDVVRVTRAKGSDFHVVAAPDESRNAVWLAWQAFRGDNYEILATSLGVDGKVAEPVVVSSSKANDWAPAIAADGKGGVIVAWDTYDKGNYDVLARDIGRSQPAVVVAASPRFEARPAILSRGPGKLWIAYEEGDEQWGKDYASVDGFRKVGFEKNPGNALYVSRTVKVKAIADGRLVELATGAEPAFGPIAGRNRSHPRLAVGAGALWLLVRHHPLATGAGEAWVTSALKFDGQAWSNPIVLPNSSNLLDNRPAVVGLGQDILVVGSSDLRENTQGRAENDLYAARISSPTDVNPREPQFVASSTSAEPRLANVHPNEPVDIRRLREHRVEVGGKLLRPLRGEFHRHTEISAHRDQDGSLEDSWRYGLDAADMDWMGNGDHMNGFNFEYIWWFIQKNAEIHNNNPRFVAAQTYERSYVYPNGHRNVMMPRRGIRPLPMIPQTFGTEAEGSPDTKLLYAYLKHFGAICASHTSGTNMGTDWRDNDPEVEPVVEIYQGHRHNYEHFGAPRSATEATHIGGYQPKGFIWNALEKGYKLGFQSSSDHVSTHWSYAIVYAEAPTREAIIDAFKKRHCYAATDNILLDVRSGAQFMGDTFTVAGKPTLDIHVQGTANVSRVHVVRDNAYVYSSEPNQRNVALRYTDDAATPGSHYYYVRVEMADGNLAWGSPMWITVK